MTVIVQTPPQGASTAAGAFLNDNAFDTLIWQHGRRVIHETALQCPCKSEASNQLSSCKNCGGTGYAYINAKETRMVVTKVNAVTEFRDWSDKIRGMINISCIENEQVSFMDRITLLDGNAIFNEVIHFKKKSTTTFAFTAYNVKKVLYCARYVDDENPYQRLTLGVHYSVENNIVRILDAGIADIEDLALTIRYYHAPQYHIMEMARETMQSWRKHPGKELESLPVSAIAQRAHYIAGAKNLNGDNMIDNSFESACEVRHVVQVCDSSNDGAGQIVIFVNTVNVTVLPTIEYSFTNQTVVTAIHNFGRLPDVSIYDNNNKQMRGQIEHLSNTAVRVTFNRSKTGKLVIQ